MKPRVTEYVMWCCVLLLGLAMLGYANQGWKGLVSNVGFGLVGLAIGRALRS